MTSLNNFGALEKMAFTSAKSSSCDAKHMNVGRTHQVSERPRLLDTEIVVLGTWMATSRSEITSLRAIPIIHDCWLPMAFPVLTP